MKICIVEDSKAIATLLQALVQRIAREKTEICYFTSGEELIEHIQNPENVRMDIALIDVGLPGISGIDLCQKVREMAGANSEYRPYLIVITGSREPDSIAKAIEAGANDYIPKPVNAKVLDIRLCVAVKLIEQAHFSEESDYFKMMALYACHYAALPIAICEARLEDPVLKISFANKAMGALLNTERTSLIGQSLADLQAWKPEFQSAIVSLLEKGRIYQGLISSSSMHWNALSIQMKIYPIAQTEKLPTHYFLTEEAQSPQINP